MLSSNSLTRSPAVNRISATAHAGYWIAASLAMLAFATSIVTSSHGQETSKSRMSLTGQPVVARVEMKLVDSEDVIDVIEKGDLLTVLEEREDDYVIVTHDGTKGAVDKNNAVRVAESVQIYSELIDNSPKEGRFRTLRASAWWALGKSEKALEDFNEAIELGYKEAHAYSSRGLFHAAAGRHDEAIADYNKAIEIDPDDNGALINRAAVNLTKGDQEEAIRDYTTAIERAPENLGLLHQRAIAYKAAGKLEDAKRDFSTLIEADPKDTRAVMGRGYIFFQQNDHEKAVEDFSAAVELTPNDPVAWNNRGYNRLQIKEYEGALADYAKAVELAPTYALALQNQAWALATVPNEKLRDAKKAIQSAEAACKLSNYEAVGDLSALAAAFAADGKFETAVGWQEKVVAKVSEQYKEFANKILDRYKNERAFAVDPDKANQEDDARAESEATKKAEQENDAVRRAAEEKLSAEEAQAAKAP